VPRAPLCCWSSKLLEKALANRRPRLRAVQGHIVLQAPTDEPHLPLRLERAYLATMSTCSASGSRRRIDRATRLNIQKRRERWVEEQVH